MPRRLVAIVGPTASGKTAVALQLADRFGGEIVNADSRQVYRGMDIGTAKPSLEERQLVPHHLFDIAEPAEGYNLALYQQHARAALDEIWSRGDVAWLVGGTPQYVWALLESWQIPDVEPDEALRSTLADFASAHGWESLHERLREVDPVAAVRIDGRNIRRVIRALEVFKVTGRPISEWQAKSEPDFETLVLATACPRPELYERIDRRVEAMILEGLVDEVQALLRAGVPPTAPALSSIGYGEVVRHLSGELSLQEAVERIKFNSHRLARSQEQWFRRDNERITPIENPEAAVSLVARFLS